MEYIQNLFQVVKNLTESNPITEAFWIFIWILLIILAIVVADVGARQ